MIPVCLSCYCCVKTSKASRHGRSLRRSTIYARRKTPVITLTRSLWTMISLLEYLHAKWGMQFLMSYRAPQPSVGNQVGNSGSNTQCFYLGAIQMSRSQSCVFLHTQVMMIHLVGQLNDILTAYVLPTLQVHLPIAEMIGSRRKR